MQLESLSCNNCGAPVEVTPTTNYLTCAHCGSRLAVKRTETAHYTEVLDRLQARVDQVDDELEDLRAENELLRLDQDWEEERKQYMVRTKDGSLVEPSMSGVTGSLIGLGAIVAAFIWFSTGSFSSSFSGLFFLLIVAAIGFSIYSIISEWTKYQEYKAAEAAYYARRDAALSRRSRKN
jgi:DNA-directed RNA polymerase subunit RPC12/RpoP